MALVVLGCHDGSPRTFSSCAPFEGRSDVGGDGVAEGVAVFDKPVITTQGATGDAVETPIRYADVEVINCNTDAVLASGSTDGDGRFQIRFNNPDRVGVYVRVLSASTSYGVSVKRSAAEPFLYGLASRAYDDAGNGETVAVTDLKTSSRLGAGAFNVFDQGVRGAQVVESLTAAVPTSPLVWYWYPGNPDGTSYNPAVKTITVLGTTADPDEFDDAVLLHEYGHYVLDVYSRDDSPGGPHALGDSTLDLRLAWSEGWATFFSSVVRNDPVHVDTSGDGVRLLFEIEGPSFGAATRYDTDELAVAAVLWDAYDDVNADEGAGPVDGLLSEVWSTIRGLATSPGSFPVSFEDFWTEWQKAPPADLQPILELRGINLWPDAQEAGLNDNDEARATPILVDDIQPHSLYPADDVDYVVFTAPADGTYTVATSSQCSGFPEVCNARVSNAADTTLDVLKVSDDGVDADNLNGRTFPPSCALASCPPNDATTLSSRVSFSAAANEVVTIQIMRSPMAPPSAGELGTYDVLVTQEESP